jgi:hypothetical protein
MQAFIMKATKYEIKLAILWMKFTAKIFKYCYLISRPTSSASSEIRIGIMALVQTQQIYVMIIVQGIITKIAAMCLARVIP